MTHTEHFLYSLLEVVNAMSPYLLLGFFIAGLLHVFVPKRFYRHLSSDNKLSVLWAALLGIPLPLCSCGVIPTAVGLKKEGASNGAVASFLIATPQTGIDSILATFSLMGLGFAITRPVAALVTGLCGGLLINRLMPADNSEFRKLNAENPEFKIHNSKFNILHRLWLVLKYAYFDMIQDIGVRLAIGLLIAAVIGVAVPDSFFLTFGSQPLLQMLVVLAVAVPMYICSTGSIPIAAALMMKGLSPGAALVMLMAGPAVNIASILVVKKSLGSRFTWIYLTTIVGFSLLFGLLTNLFSDLSILSFDFADASSWHDACGHCAGSDAHDAHFSTFNTICSILLVLFILFALTMKLIDKFKKPHVPTGTTAYTVEGMHCAHCKAACEQAVGQLDGVISCEANPAAKTLAVTGTASESDIRKAVEQAGFTFKGEK